MLEKDLGKGRTELKSDTLTRPEAERAVNFFWLVSQFPSHPTKKVSSIFLCRTQKWIDCAVLERTVLTGF
jgi:hypothetical protein